MCKNKLISTKYIPFRDYRLQSQSESSSGASGPHPYRMPQMLQEKFGDDFPLRKTGKSGDIFLRLP